MPHATQNDFLTNKKHPLYLAWYKKYSWLLLLGPHWANNPLWVEALLARCRVGKRFWLDKRSTGCSSSSATSTGLSVGALGPVKIPHKYHEKEVLSGFHIYQISSKLQTTDSKMLKTWEVRNDDSLDLGSIFSVPVVLPTLQVVHCPHFLLWLKIWQSVAPFICR